MLLLHNFSVIWFLTKLCCLLQKKMHWRKIHFREFYSKPNIVAQRNIKHLPVQHFQPIAPRSIQYYSQPDYQFWSSRIIFAADPKSIQTSQDKDYPPAFQLVWWTSLERHSKLNQYTTHFDMSRETSFVLWDPEQFSTAFEKASCLRVSSLTRLQNSFELLRIHR